jgi:hypothetical protein
MATRLGGVDASAGAVDRRAALGAAASAAAALALAGGGGAGAAFAAEAATVTFETLQGLGARAKAARLDARYRR